MSLRKLLEITLLAGAGYVAWGIMTGKNTPSVSAPVGSDTTASGSGGFDFTGYLNKLATVESSNQPYAKAKTSTASGLFQFTKATWQSLGGTWGPDDSLPFGGLHPTVAEQMQRAAQLTAQNASILSSAGIAISNAMLYAAHFLGPHTAVAVLRQSSSTPIANAVSMGVINANPFLRNMSVGGFTTWLRSKVG